MNYYIFKDQIFTIFLSMTHLTAVSFTERVQDYVGGTKSEFQIYELNKKRSLVYETKSEDIDRNFIVFLRDSKYHYNLKYNNFLSDKDINIKEAKKCSLFSLIKENQNYKLFECPKSLLLINKSKKVVSVNNELIKDKKYISKGPPVFFENKLIYFRGKAL